MLQLQWTTADHYATVVLRKDAHGFLAASNGVPPCIVKASIPPVPCMVLMLSAVFSHLASRAA